MDIPQWLFRTICVFFIFLSSVAAPVLAVDLKHETDFVAVQILSDASSVTSKVGDRFEMMLKDTISNKQLWVPAGTRLIGHVFSKRSAQEWGHDPRIEICWTQITWPDGNLKLLAMQGTACPYKMAFYRQGYRSSPTLRHRRTAFKVAGTAVGLPLLLTPAAPLGVVALASDAASAGIGAAQEVAIHDPEPDGLTGKKAKRVALGALDGATSIPTVANFVLKEPELRFQKNQVMNLPLPKMLWEAINSPR